MQFSVKLAGLQPFFIGPVIKFGGARKLCLKVGEPVDRLQTEFRSKSEIWGLLCPHVTVVVGLAPLKVSFRLAHLLGELDIDGGLYGIR